jgi:hypothetical protein
MAQAALNHEATRRYGKLFLALKIGEHCHLPWAFHGGPELYVNFFKKNNTEQKLTTALKTLVDEGAYRSNSGKMLFDTISMVLFDAEYFSPHLIPKLKTIEERINNYAHEALWTYPKKISPGVIEVVYKYALRTNALKEFNVTEKELEEVLAVLKP